MLDLLASALPSIDWGGLHAQVATAGAQIVNSPAGPALDTAKDGVFGGSIARVLTDAFHAAWGGHPSDPTKRPPTWILIVAPLVFGTVGVGLALAMKGISPFDLSGIAYALGIGTTTAGPIAVTTATTSNLAQTGNPTVALPNAAVDAIVMTTQPPQGEVEPVGTAASPPPAAEPQSAPPALPQLDPPPSSARPDVGAFAVARRPALPRLRPAGPLPWHR